MDGKINWKNILFLLEENKTLEERIISQKIVVGISIIFFGLLLIFPLDGMLAKTFIGDINEKRYTIYSGIIKILLMFYSYFLYHKARTGISLSIEEFKNPIIHPIQKSEIFEKYPILGKNLGFKGFLGLVTFLIIIMLIFISWR